MSEEEELIEAAMLLKEHCGKIEQCNECTFYGGSKPCALTGGNPHCWAVKKPCRWSKKDYDLAKALEAFGVDIVRKAVMTDEVTWISENEFGKLPRLSFANLKSGEYCEISRIIKEYEEENSEREEDANPCGDEP